MIFALFGYLAAVVFLIGDTHYILDTVRGTSRPHRVAMGIFMVMNIIDLANQRASGATSSLWLFVAALATTTIIFLVSLKKGAGGAEPLDIVVLAGGVLGLGLWVWLHTPLASIVCNAAVTVLAMLPILKKSYLDPYSEAPLAWLLCGLGGVLSAVSVGQWNLALLILPVLSAVEELAVWAIVVLRRPRVPFNGHSQAAASDPAPNLV